MEQTALKERFLDDACMIFMKNMEDIDINRVKAVLTMALDGYTLQKDTKEVTVYEGDSNERLFKAFLVSKKVSGLSDKTVKQYAYQLKKIFEKIGKRAEEVTTNDLRVYFAKRELDDHISDVSRQNERRVLSTFYLWLQDEGIVMTNPVRKFPNIKTRKKKKEAFSDMDVEKIRNCVRSERQAAMIEILSVLWHEENYMSEDNRNVCGNCQHRFRKRKHTGDIVDRCAIDKHYISYTSYFTHKCEYWEKKECKNGTTTN